jgi:hypothetical protein
LRTGGAEYESTAKEKDYRRGAEGAEKSEDINTAENRRTQREITTHRKFSVQGAQRQRQLPESARERSFGRLEAKAPASG